MELFCIFELLFEIIAFDMIVFPNAKINLGLNIINKREDGYHNIESVFYPIPVCDVLEIIPSENQYKNFTLEVIDLPDDGKMNLVEKAYNAISKNYTIPPIEIILKKNIPFAAGLGGGSSDAAYTLKTLADMFVKDINEQELHEMAKSIGADVPFFIKNKPVYAEGIGTDFSDIEISLKGYHIVLIKPDIAVSTAEAYSGVKPSTPNYNLKEVIKLPVNEWKNIIKNDFEDSLFPKYPRLKDIKDSLYEIGAKYASMSGSGSSIFGLFKTIPSQVAIESIIKNNEIVFVKEL